jgi:hypothetical protein
LVAEEFCFRSFIQAGFECSTQRLKCGKRLDLLSSTRHDCFGKLDLDRLQDFGIRTIRTGARWHLVEPSPGQFDFSSLEGTLRDADETGTEVLLDLFHFGWPDHTHVFAPEFLSDFARYIRAAVRFLKVRGASVSAYAPANEISFLSWAGADVGCVNPYVTGRGGELKRILVKAAVLASDILLNELPGARLLWPEPVIYIAGDIEVPGDDLETEAYRTAQFETWDLISGRLEPELGGRPEYLDLIGTNFYDRNQWVHNGQTLFRTDLRYKPFSRILEEVWERYRRPIMISETGTEGEERAGWFDYVCDEIAVAHGLGVPVHGVCLYPILNHPGWEDDRHCCNGLFDYADDLGNRDTYLPLAQVIIDQQPKLLRSYQSIHALQQHRPDLFLSSPLGIRFPTTATPDEPVREQPEGVLF